MQTKGELTRKLQLQNSDLVEVEVEIHCIVSAKMYIRALKRYQDPFFFVISSLNVIDNVAANPYEIF